MLDSWFYFLVGSAIFICSLYKSKRAYYICLVMLFLFTALRYWNFGGTDALIYKNYFVHSTDINTLFDYNKYQIGYAALNWIIRRISGDYYVYQIAYATISLLLLHFVINEMDFDWDEKCLVLFTYLCLRFIYNEWVSLRQNIAVLLFWLFILKYYKCEEKEYKKRIVFLALALILPYAFHTSISVAWISIPLLLLFEKLDFKQKAVVVPIISLVIHFFAKNSFSTILSFAISVDDRYSMYIGKEDLTSNIIYYLVRLMFFVFYCLRYEKEPEELRDGILDLLSFSIIVFSFDFEIASRMAEYFAIGLYASTACFYKTFSERSKKMSMAIYYICMMVIFLRFVNYFGSGYAPISPYRTFLFGT